MKKKKLTKREKPKAWDIAVTNNYRLTAYNKPKGKSNARPVVVTSTKPPKVARIMGITEKNKGKLGVHRVELKHTKGLKKNSAVDKQEFSEVYSTKKEIDKKLPKKRKLDLNDRSVISKKVGKVERKDKKQIKNMLK